MLALCGLIDDEEADDDDRLVGNPAPCPTTIAACPFRPFMAIEVGEMFEPVIMIPSAPDEADDADEVESCKPLVLSFLAPRFDLFFIFLSDACC